MPRASLHRRLVCVSVGFVVLAVVVLDAILYFSLRSELPAASLRRPLAAEAAAPLPTGDARPGSANTVVTPDTTAWPAVMGMGPPI